MSAPLRLAPLALAAATAVAAVVALPSPSDAQQQQQQQRRGQPQRPAQPAAQPTRIPPPGPAEVPLFPAREYTDPRSNVALTVPAGWLVVEIPQVAEGEITRMFMEGPGTPAPNCTVVVVRPQQPPRATQAQLNRVVHTDQSVNGMRTQLSREGRRVVNIRKVTQAGIAGVVAQVAIPGSQHAPELTTFVTIFEQVGRRYSVNCNTLSADLDTMRPDIEAILRSFRFPTS
jgi:hypothetical protein